MAGERQAGQDRSISPDRRAGRDAAREELRRRLTSATPGFLLGAAGNPNLTVTEMRLLLRNNQAPAALLAEIGRERRWARYQQVKQSLAVHPHTPLVLGRNLLPHLCWTGLAEVALAPQVNPVLRREAEKILAARAQDMTLGERIALARRATPRVIEVLGQIAERDVLLALLGNSRLVEADAVKIASGSRTPGEVLAALAVHSRWGCRRAVRLALAENRRTPVAAALRILRELTRGDLRRLGQDPDVPRIVRIGAERAFRREPGQRPATRADGRRDHA